MIKALTNVRPRTLRGRVQHFFARSGDESWPIERLVRALKEADEELAQEGLNPAPAARAARKHGDAEYLTAYARFWQFEWLAN
jgi:uncharacterized protein YdaU (DUF1376 family)